LGGRVVSRGDAELKVRRGSAIWVAIGHPALLD
jgi:hypothetical protein